MRIGLLTGEYPPHQGGIGAHCRVLSRTLAAQGHTVHIFSTSDTSSPDPDIQLSNPIDRWHFGCWNAIRRWADAEKLDVINLHYQTAAFAMSPWIHFIPQMMKRPVITTFHDLRTPYLFPKAGPVRGWIVNHLARTSDGVIVTNHEDLLQISVQVAAAIIPIGSSIPAELPADFDRQALRQRAGAAEDDLLIAHFGFINHSKGVDVLLEALALLRDQGLPVRLMMIGGRTGTADPTNAAYAERIDAQITALGLTDRIYWTGFVDDAAVSAYLKAADLAALPFRDGASYRRSSLMAVIHNQCPVITTQPAVAIDTFRDGDNLLLVPAGDSQALADRITRYSQDGALQERIQRGIGELKSHFDWDDIARQNVSYFQQITGAGS